MKASVSAGIDNREAVYADRFGLCRARSVTRRALAETLHLLRLRLRSGRRVWTATGGRGRAEHQSTYL